MLYAIFMLSTFYQIKNSYYKKVNNYYLDVTDKIISINVWYYTEINLKMFLPE